MFGRYREITYTAPLKTPIDTDAYHLQANGDWRLFVFTGTPSNKFIYQRFLRVAPHGLDVVVLTRPGFGRGHEDPITDFDEQVAAIRPFLPGGEFGDKKIVTMGVSYGGELALKAALDFPGQILGVVTVAALIDEPHDYALKLEQLGGESGIESYVPNRWQKVRAEIAGRRAQIGPLMERLKSLKAPVEVMHGDFDALVPRSNAETLMGALPESVGALEIVPGGTHYLEGQYPRRVHRAVQRVIERAESGLQAAQSAGKTA
ncbi:alpha/beta hydrolase [Hyphococcus flavus]|uniref:Alpha/beta hydrolase n=1 Tax=Hyphococcus flavus TaxID=1866326 RepID=A0AAE9ZE66_9PROT|nr:alpha/beta hydrolase [Hyphococcus flavus]WDI31387.1 alpha/beta hydrolase [Hyphococcus flavus]